MFTWLLMVIKEIKVQNINSASINGYTYYYIQADEKKYKLSITLSDNLPFVKNGDVIKIGYYETENDIIKVEKMY